ncbi:MAG TPA: ATP-binding cassette domain-containing protein [Sulfuricurvum sp.]|nr:MAG: molybdenum ABC transporter ATP-binding protein [Campylobacterales bacterium 16-40-21]OZA03684.1 MAG: molybdenum ABC transporter ATP-binding protein [Sulfuricurvum sp. 17-40-25]HQS65800.1 ATP-binding cassette domain-containing protein [Sulfuricurvum sp.]HQT37604.1 ATP-binding cassette domain-containing protein [Sulfuricurvum sp.]
MIFINIKKKLHAAEGNIEANFELEIDDGEFLTLFGPSGAGKTTLLRMIAGLEKPDSGIIRVDDEIWFDSTKKINLSPQKRSIGFVFQDYALFPTMSINENLRFAASDKTEQSFIDELLDITELTNLAHRLPDTLSGGQKQRVALVRALVRHPKILLLDEPLSALDSTMRTKLQDELALIHARLGVTTLLVSHDIAETVKLSNRMAQIESGKIVHIAKPLEFFSSNTLSGKLNLIGDVLSIQYDAPIYVVTLLVGQSVVKTVVGKQEAQLLHVGEKAIISSKAFNPILMPLK